MSERRAERSALRSSAAGDGGAERRAGSGSTWPSAKWEAIPVSGRLPSPTEAQRKRRPHDADGLAPFSRQRFPKAPSIQPGQRLG